MKLLDFTKAFFERHERILSPVTLVGGFIFDYFTLERVDFLWDNIFVILYIFLAGGSIALLNIYEERRPERGFIESTHEFLPFALQFALGGLFSAFVIFYSQSASLYTSGIFILILLFLFIGNEFFRTRYTRLVFQVGVYFTATFFFLIYFLPVLVKKMGVGTFISSGILALSATGAFIIILSRLVPARYRASKRRVLGTVAGIFITINFLYFTNIIPPIPLSLRSGDVYHSVERTTEGYLAMGEANTWWERLGFPQKIHISSGREVYAFSAVFAPTDLRINVVHNWQFWDDAESRWQSATRITFPILGGRDDGYRGFSRKANIFPGRWRVDIETERGQVIGRVRFNVVEGSAVLEEKEI